VSAIPNTGCSSRIEECELPFIYSANRNDSCLYYYLCKKSSDTFASPSGLTAAKARIGTSIPPTPSLATLFYGDGRLSPAEFAFRPHRAWGFSIGMLIVLLTPADLKEPVHAGGSLRPFDIAVRIADNRR
jgi:hypothetical protein